MDKGKDFDSLLGQMNLAVKDDVIETSVKTAAEFNNSHTQQMGSLEGRHGRFDLLREGSHHREETSAQDAHMGQASSMNQGQSNVLRSRDVNNREQPGANSQIVKNLCPVRYMNRVLYIPTGGFLRPQHLVLQSMESEEWKLKVVVRANLLDVWISHHCLFGEMDCNGLLTK